MIFCRVGTKPHILQFFVIIFLKTKIIMTKPIGNCKYCDKPLRAFGKERKNGKSHDDWETREYHKKCYIEEQKYKDIYYNFKKFMITDNDKIDFLLN